MQGASNPKKESSGSLWSRVFGSGAAAPKQEAAQPAPRLSAQPPPAEPQPGLVPLPRIKAEPGKPVAPAKKAR